MIGASGLSDDDDGKNDGLKWKPAAILKGGSVKVQKYTSVIQCYIGEDFFRASIFLLMRIANSPLLGQSLVD
jgi:hypothetical protein